VAPVAATSELEQQLAARIEAEAAAAAELEREIAAKEYAEATAAAALAEGQQKLAEQRDEFERRLAAADQRVAELTNRLAAAESRAAELQAQIATSPSAASTGRSEAAADAPSDAARSFGEPVSEEAGSAGFGWSSSGAAWGSGAPQASSDEDVFGTAPANEPNSTGSAWGASPAAWDQPAGEESHANDGWTNAADAAKTVDDSNPWRKQSAEPASSDSGPFGGKEFAREPQREALPWSVSADFGASNAPQDESLSAENVNWSQEAVQPESLVDAPTARVTADPFARPATVEDAAAKKSAPTSYIERYAHMFADDATAEDEKPAPTAPPRRDSDDSFVAKPRNMGIVRRDGQAAAQEEDDESIEQYMAKLLQRVRGEAAATSRTFIPAARIAQPESEAEDAGAPLPPVVPAMTSVLTKDGEALEVEAVEKPASFEPVKRKAPAVMPTTDLGALRALANETARLAISRHELRKLRRNAVTKVIVATLAGVTSLWLMLEAPSWRDMQFITACFSLLVAAYWAGETYRTMLESFRLASNDGPEADELSEALVDAGLPIDVTGGER
jgi:hypothetical protein